MGSTSKIRKADSTAYFELDEFAPVCQRGDSLDNDGKLEPDAFRVSVHASLSEWIEAKTGASRASDSALLIGPDERHRIFHLTKSCLLLAQPPTVYYHSSEGHLPRLRIYVQEHTRIAVVPRLHTASLWGATLIIVDTPSVAFFFRAPRPSMCKIQSNALEIHGQIINERQRSRLHLQFIDLLFPLSSNWNPSALVRCPICVHLRMCMQQRTK